jgi:hypothetical protein
MNELIDFFKSWGTLLLGLLTLIFGGGWLKSYFELRHKERELERQRYRAILDNFIGPFEGISKDTRKIFDELTDDRELPLLEYYPQRLEHYFSSLPNDDPRKLLWKVRVQRLLLKNGQAVELIRRFRGQMVLDSFKKACDKFVYHAEQWEDLWKAVEGSRPWPNSKDTPEGPFAERFPSELEPALQDELAEVKRRAGVR